MAKWNVGDSVSVRMEDDFLDGIIQETRGGGWYSVQLLQDDSKTATTSTTSTSTSTTTMAMMMKCRGTQLRQAASTTTTVPVSSLSFSPPNRARPTVHVDDPGVEPEYPPPPPTIHDLDAAVLDLQNISNPRDRELLEQVQHHASFDKWVVFTDLHCAPATLDTCLKVLTRVHELARERHAGVLFLGDFWHHRGTLRVDCLNAVLEHFRGWDVPMVMIPGNHDQVTLGGHSHGLTPMENAYRVGNGNIAGPLVLSYPTKFRDALFVPHIRDTATMESILQSSCAQEASALFVHAEVKGALMNDLMVSTNGIPTSSFPIHKRIYSGHFHKPHTVKSANGVQIEYLGSPYETTLAEAQQLKTLAVLDADWQCIEYIPIDIGRRHFKASSWEELLQLNLKRTTDSSEKGHDTDSVKSGDRIVVSIPKEEAEYAEAAVSTHTKMLREAGVMVEIREMKNVPLDPMGSSGVGDGILLEEMTPESTWKAYLKEEESRETLSDDSAKVLLEAGLEILEEVEAQAKPTAAQPTSVTDLTIASVSLEGFGPFRKAATYPLLNRGLVLLKGTNNDSGSDR
jgi:DNA repair exonuclease SbcCD nuclease subunit